MLFSPPPPRTHFKFFGRVGTFPHRFRPGGKKFSDGLGRFEFGGGNKLHNYGKSVFDNCVYILIEKKQNTKILQSAKFGSFLAKNTFFLFFFSLHLFVFIYFLFFSFSFFLFFLFLSFFLFFIAPSARDQKN